MNKFLTWEILKSINESSIRARRNRNFNFEKLPILPAEKYPVVFSMLHNDVEMRVQILFNDRGDRGFLDMSIEQFNSLPAAIDEK